MSIITYLAQKLALPEAIVKEFLFDAPKKYKIYKIPKRTIGYRTIAQPSAALKQYQRVFLEWMSWNVHSSATAYVKKRSIKDNAIAHAKNRFLLKMDFSNFFHSIDPSIFWYSCLQNGWYIEEDDKIWIERLIFWAPNKANLAKLVLSIGSPCSPTISNFCMYLFDAEMFEFCQKRNICYTRYADDLSFSTSDENVLKDVAITVEKLLNDRYFGKIRLNRSKTVYTSMRHNRHITGITLNNYGNISLGRERKRYIKHLVHQYVLGRLNGKEVEQLKGFLSFASHIEPQFILNLHTKYSSDVLGQLMKRVPYESND